MAGVQEQHKKNAGKGFPFVPIAVVTFCVLLSTLSLAIVSHQSNDEKPLLVFVGDSFTGNYRFHKGQRLQDQVESMTEGEWQAFNHARPGARTLDIVMQAHQARWFHDRVDAVVLPLQISKLMPWESPVRMDKRGDNLKWWNVDLESPLWASFDEEYKKKVLIHKIGLLMGFLDLGEFLFVEHIQSPKEREEMRADPPKRREKILKKIEAIEDHWTETSVVVQDVFDSQAARDLEVLVEDLQTAGIPLLVVVVPTGNPQVVQEQFSEEAQRHIKEAEEATLAWCKNHNLTVVNLATSLPGSAYDDFAHLKGIEGNKAITLPVVEWLRSL